MRKQAGHTQQGREGFARAANLLSGQALRVFERLNASLDTTALEEARRRQPESETVEVRELSDWIATSWKENLAAVFGRAVKLVKNGETESGRTMVAHALFDPLVDLGGALTAEAMERYFRDVASDRGLTEFMAGKKAVGEARKKQLDMQ